jgi:hypothetical protein
MTRAGFLLRRGLPLGVVVGGLAGFLSAPSASALQSAAVVVGVGCWWLALGVVLRFDAHPERTREVEDAARDFLDQHGRWPAEEEYAHFRRHGRWGD